MQIQEYIQSGVIESYVLGLASTDEVAELEANRLQYSEIDDAIDSFSALLEEQAFKNAIPPPAYLKDRILQAVQVEAPPPAKLVHFPESLEQSQLQTPKISKWKYLAAASVILFVLSGLTNIVLYNKYSQRSADYTALLSERNTLQANNQIYQSSLKEWQTASQMMADPLMLVIKMKDPAGKSKNLAAVFWNSNTKDVYIMPVLLPQPVKGKQYQLWALVNGKPVDAGMLQVNCEGLCKMKNIPAAQAFAVTLEDEGGSPTPNLDAMYVLGKV